MPRVGGGWPEERLPQAEQIVFAKDPGHPLVVGLPAFPLQECGDPPIAIVAMRNRQPLDGVAQRRLLDQRRMLAPVAVVGRAAHLGEPAQPLDRPGTLRSRALRMRHRRDLGEDTGAPGAMSVPLAASIRRKAPLKKSRSSAC